MYPFYITIETREYCWLKAPRAPEKAIRITFAQSEQIKYGFLTPWGHLKQSLIFEDLHFSWQNVLNIRAWYNLVYVYCYRKSILK